MIIREYKPDDCVELATLFYDTVHCINAMDYTKEQLDVWATGNVDIEAWNRSFLNNNTLVAELNEKIVGFGDLDKTGYLDRLFVHKEFQGQGIATALLKHLENNARDNDVYSFETYASITSKPFFEKQGYIIEKENVVMKKGVSLMNYKMVK